MRPTRTRDKKMKKTALLITFAGMFIGGYSQDVKVNINNQETSTANDCTYRINGICSTEDIGGVDAEFREEKEANDYTVTVVFTNYNSFTVTVLYELGYSLTTGTPREEEFCENPFDGKNGTIVIPPNGKKEVVIGSRAYCMLRGFSLRGIIVRKLRTE